MGARLSGPAGAAGRTVEQNADINVTPFVDIMLVLLIIFMVAAPLATVSLNLDLPPPKESALPHRDPVYVTVQNDGSLYIAEKATGMATLAADVCDALGGGECRKERVFVRAQAEVPYERFMAVMNDLQLNGFHQVGLLNEDIV
ncbi:biopolymer transporter ExbD [Brevundimonas lenta]|uniref:Biopolymer transport protein ExbD n=1 Tax=Brevundimonas lenta TaxID=424796 RepID=A0A7W6NNL6_9CAUL|nr:biopolymer transporter ExbD [Brevundimonas lenta]MBB4082485.1 biopolymer transport protein ExbD [Brevundimonas lenta]